MIGVALVTLATSSSPVATPVGMPYKQWGVLVGANLFSFYSTNV